MFKKLAVALLISTVMLTVAGGCGGKSSDTGDEQKQEATQTSIGDEIGQDLKQPQ